MNTTVTLPTDEAIEKAGRVLRNGGLVAIPTETVYGLAANALDADAVRSIYAAKGRPSDNPLIVHISDFSQWERLVLSIPDEAKALADAFWPGPLTVILKKSDLIPSVTSGGLETVAVRLPSNEIARRVIDAAGVPLAAPSANLSGKPSPTSSKHVIADLDGRIDMIIDGGDCEVGVESTVVTLAGEKPRVLRPGGVTAEQLRSVLGEIEIDDAVFHRIPDGETVSSPGMKYKHYSPRADITLVEGSDERFFDILEKVKDEDPVVLCFDEDKERLEAFRTVSFGSKNDYLNQAHNLFSALRKLDEIGAERAFARLPKSDGVGLAVFNRLIRSAGFKVI